MKGLLLLALASVPLARIEPGRVTTFDADGNVIRVYPQTCVSMPEGRPAPTCCCPGSTSEACCVEWCKAREKPPCAGGDAGFPQS